MYSGRRYCIRVKESSVVVRRSAGDITLLRCTDGNAAKKEKNVWIKNILFRVEKNGGCGGRIRVICTYYFTAQKIKYLDR